jgi:hypothetical protein
VTPARPGTSRSRHLREAPRAGFESGVQFLDASGNPFGLELGFLQFELPPGLFGTDFLGTGTGRLPGLILLSPLRFQRLELGAGLAQALFDLQATFQQLVALILLRTHRLVTLRQCLAQFQVARLQLPDLVVHALDRLAQ